MEKEIEAILLRFQTENAQHRGKLDTLFSRVVGSIGKGDYSDVTNVLRDLSTISGERDTPELPEKSEGRGSEEVQTGGTDGSVGLAIAPGSPEGNTEKP